MSLHLRLFFHDSTGAFIGSADAVVSSPPVAMPEIFCLNLISASVCLTF